MFLYGVPVLALTKLVIAKARRVLVLLAQAFLSSTCFKLFTRAGELLLCLLSALLATQHFARLLTTLAPRHVSLEPWRAQGDAATGDRPLA